jgi:hypothetical protein
VTSTATPARPHTDAVQAALEAADLLVGRGVKPTGGGWQGEPGTATHIPYVVLFPGPGMTDGDLCDSNEYLDYRVQATCVAATQEGAEAVADAVKATLAGQRLTVTGRSLYPFQILGDQPATRDDQVAPPVHYAIVQFACRSGPA